MIELIDDGTLDTVLRCSDCGETMRYNYDGGDIDEDTGPPSYDAFVEWAIDDADNHVCDVWRIQSYHYTKVNKLGDV